MFGLQIVIHSGIINTACKMDCKRCTESFFLNVIIFAHVQLIHIIIRLDTVETNCINIGSTHNFFSSEIIVKCQ